MWVMGSQHPPSKQPFVLMITPGLHPTAIIFALPGLIETEGIKTRPDADVNFAKIEQ